MHLVPRTSVKVTWSSIAPTSVTVVLLPESCESLLLGVRIDVGTNDESDDVEEGHPCLLGQELLRECERDGRCGPRDLHDRHEAGPNGGAHLVEGTGAGNDGHASQVDGVLDGRDLVQ